MAMAIEIATYIRQRLGETMPRETGYMINLSLNANQVSGLGDKMAYFEIGNSYAEEKAPYYHILEDAEVIHKRDRGTKQSKGSQENITPLGQRNYGFQKVRKADKEGVVHDIWKNEYRKNVRGSRSRVGKATDYRYMGKLEINGKTLYTVRNQNAPYYVNRHYHYIEKSLDDMIVEDVAKEFGLKIKRKSMMNDTEAIEQSVSELLKFGSKGE